MDGQSLKKEDRICNICFCDFDENDLLENQSTKSKEETTSKSPKNDNVSSNTSTSSKPSSPSVVDEDGDLEINDIG